MMVFWIRCFSFKLSPWFWSGLENTISLEILSGWKEGYQLGNMRRNSVTARYACTWKHSRWKQLFPFLFFQVHEFMSNFICFQLNYSKFFNVYNLLENYLIGLQTDLNLETFEKTLKNKSGTKNVHIFIDLEIQLRK